MFVNLSNHPSGSWSEKQLAAAREFGEIVDLHFPNIDPSLSPAVMSSVADNTVDTIMTLGKDVVVHVMGEMTFTYAVVTRLKALGIRCVASTTERKTTYSSDGTKLSEFSFVMFRDY